MKRTAEQIEKLTNAAPMGWTFDKMRFLYPFEHGDEYPQYFRTIEKNAEYEIIESIYYFKRFNGTGDYKTKKTKFLNNGERVKTGKEIETRAIESASRFNLKRLLEIAENLN